MKDTAVKLAVIGLGVGAIVADSVSAQVSMVCDGLFIGGMLCIVLSKMTLKS